MLKKINLGVKKPRIGSKQRVVKKRSVSQGNSVLITIDPKNPKNKYYTKVERTKDNKLSKITHVTTLAKEVLKENPELITFLEEKLSKPTPDLKARLETKNGSFRLMELTNYQSNALIYELRYKNKNTGETKRYFVKKNARHYLENLNPDSEFLAIKEMERLGLNVIKPQFSFTDLNNSSSNIIIYDFTNLNNYYDAVIKRKIAGSEILQAEELFKRLEKSKFFSKFDDFTRFDSRVVPHNVFVKRLLNGKLEFYFSDICLTKEAYDKRKERYT